MTSRPSSTRVPRHGMVLRPALAIAGMTNRAELTWLAERAHTAAVVIEVGSYLGRSTRALADACPGTVYAVDPWDGPCVREDGTVTGREWAVFPQFARHLRAHIATGRVVPLRSTLPAAADRLEAARVQADLVFIDGDHRYASVAADIAAARRLTRAGGTICGHDYTNATWPGVARAAQEAFGPRLRTATRSLWWAEAA